ncbi:hypothetical protein Hanom_Chr10g00913431 [Helianthus anomalus]
MHFFTAWIFITFFRMALCRDPTANVPSADATEEFPYMMFEEQYGSHAEVDKLQTLVIGCNVSPEVVDAWVHVLNIDPTYHDPSLPRHLFCLPHQW